MSHIKINNDPDALIRSQEGVLGGSRSGEAAQVGEGEADDVEVSLLLEVCGERGHQSHRRLGVEQDHEGHHADLSGQVLLQEQAHGDVLNLETEVLFRKAWAAIYTRNFEKADYRYHSHHISIRNHNLLPRISFV